MILDPQYVVQLLGAMALFLTASASFIAAMSSLRNGKIVTKVQNDIDENTKLTLENNTKINQVGVDVNGRFSEVQRQLSRLIEHMINAEPDTVAKAAKAAEMILTTAEMARLKLAEKPDAPIDVHVVTGNTPIPVDVISRDHSKGEKT